MHARAPASPQLGSYCNGKHKDTSKSKIDYAAFVERVMQLEAQHEAARRGAADAKGANAGRSLVADFHKFEDFFRGRVVECVRVVWWWWWWSVLVVGGGGGGGGGGGVAAAAGVL